MEHSKIYNKYNSDSGDQDLSTENQIAEGDKLCNPIGSNIDSKI